MKKISRKILTLCLVGIMIVGIGIFVYVSRDVPVTSDSISGAIPETNYVKWEQPEGSRAFSVSALNEVAGPLNVTITDPSGNQDRHIVQPDVNQLIVVNNDAAAGIYEIDFMTGNGVVAGEYEVKWSAESFEIPETSSKSGAIPETNSVKWEQPEGSRAFSVSALNEVAEPLNVTITDPSGNQDRHIVQPGVNQVIVVNNDAAAGIYEIDFMTGNGVVAGEYEVKWSAESFEVPETVSGMSPETGYSKYGMIPSDGSMEWEQLDGQKAFGVSAWNQGEEVLDVTLTYPDGKKKEEGTLQPGANEEIFVDNNAVVGEYKLDFSTPSGMPTGEYGIRWSTVPL